MLKKKHLLIFKNVFMLVIFVYSLWRNVYSSPQLFFKNQIIRGLFFLRSSILYILKINLLSYIQFGNIFSSFVVFPFTLLIVSFVAQTLFSLMQPHVYFCFCCLRFWLYPYSFNFTNHQGNINQNLNMISPLTIRRTIIFLDIFLVGR